VLLFKLYITRMLRAGVMVISEVALNMSFGFS